MIVVDASLATKWFLNEADSDRARRFLNDKQGQLCGPDVLAIDCDLVTCDLRFHAKAGSAYPRVKLLPDFS